MAAFFRRNKMEYDGIVAQAKAYANAYRSIKNANAKLAVNPTNAAAQNQKTKANAAKTNASKLLMNRINAYINKYGGIVTPTGAAAAPPPPPPPPPAGTPLNFVPFEVWANRENVKAAANNVALNALYKAARISNNVNGAKYKALKNTRFPAVTGNKATAMAAFKAWYTSNGVKGMGNNTARARMYRSILDNNRGKNYMFTNEYGNTRAINSANNTEPNAANRRGFWEAVAKFNTNAAAAAAARGVPPQNPGFFRRIFRRGQPNP
jgi:hypothetical protein